MKVYAITSPVYWLLSLPLRPLFLPMVVYVFMFGSISISNDKTILPPVDSLVSFFLQLPFRLVVAPPLLVACFLFGSMDIE